MKILHLFRGFEDYMIEVLNIQATEFDVHVVIPEASNWMTSLLAPNISIAKLSPNNVKSLKNIAYIIQLITYIVRLKPDVIHIQAGVIWESTIAFFLKKRFKIATTIHDVTCHPSQNNDTSMQKWINFSIRNSKLLIVHTQEGNSELKAHHPKIKSLVVPHPIIRQYKPKITPRESNKLIFFGSLDKWKGLEVFEQSLRLLKNESLKVEIRGNTKHKDYYESLFSYHSNVLLDIKRQSTDHIEQLFSTGTILILPYIEASQSGVLHIALSYKIPVIASNTGGLKELIETHKVAIGCEPGDAIDLANKIRRLIRNNEEMENIRDNQARYASNAASPSSIIKLYKTAYNYLTNNAP